MLGRVQSHLNGALQRTLGDGLLGLKAVRTAGADPWALERFARETPMVHRVLREGVRRQACCGALRDGLVVVSSHDGELVALAGCVVRPEGMGAEGP